VKISCYKVTNYQGAFSFLDHSASERETQMRKLPFIDKILMTMNSVKQYRVSIELKKSENEKCCGKKGRQANVSTALSSSLKLPRVFL